MRATRGRGESSVLCAAKFCTGGAAAVVSVRTAGEVPKEKVFQVAHALNTTLARLPIAAGDVVISDVCGTGVCVVATKSAK